MDRKKFEDIKNYCEKEGFDHLVGWAIWDEYDIENVDMFDAQNIKDTLPKLREGIVLMGINASKRKSDEEKKSQVKKTWAGFHSRHQGGKDSWLRELVKKHPELEGAYMTDVFKWENSYLPEVKRKFKEEIKEREKQYDLLERELSLLGNNLRIVLIGDDAEKFFRMFEDERNMVGTHHLFKIPHYAGRITRDNFFIEAERGLKKEITHQEHSTILGL